MLVYIRQFSDRGAEMTLSAVLQGHEAEVTQVRLPIIRTRSQGVICVQKIRRHLDIVFHAAKLFATTQVLVTETRTHHEITFFYR